MAAGIERRVINSDASTVINGRAQLVYILLLSVCMFVRYRFSRQPLNRSFWNLARVFDMMSERQLSILVSNGCIINDLSHKLCVGRSVTSDRYKKPKLRRHNALVSLHFNPTSNIWRQKHWTNWRAAGGERRVINSHASTVFNGRAQLVYLYYYSVFVCPLPFFSATAEPFALKLGRRLWCGVGKTAKHFGEHWMDNQRDTA